MCLTASGHVYAVGDKLAKQIKLSADSFKAFGFYQLPVALHKVDDVVKPEAKQEIEDASKEPEVLKVSDSVLGLLFGDADQPEPE